MRKDLIPLVMLMMTASADKQVDSLLNTQQVCTTNC